MVSGSQQGLDLLAKVLIDPGDTVLVETPTYLGALQSFSLFDPKYVSVASDEDGLLPDALSESMRGAKFSLLPAEFPKSDRPSPGRRAALSVGEARARTRSADS